MGHVSEPFQSGIGWHIVEISERRESRLATFEEMHDEIQLWMENQQRKEALEAFRKQIRSRNFSRLEYFPAASELKETNE